MSSTNQEVLHNIYVSHWSDSDQSWGKPFLAEINYLGLPFAYFSAENFNSAIEFVSKLKPLISLFKKGYFPENFWLGEIPNVPKKRCIFCVKEIPHHEDRNISIFGHHHLTCTDNFLSEINKEIPIDSSN